VLCVPRLSYPFGPSRPLWGRGTDGPASPGTFGGHGDTRERGFRSVPKRWGTLGDTTPRRLFGTRRLVALYCVVWPTPGHPSKLLISRRGLITPQ
jgi:hypothetical protein